MENGEAKSREKIDFIGVWFERMRGWKIGRVQVFSPSPPKCSIPKLERKPAQNIQIKKPPLCIVQSSNHVRALVQYFFFGLLIF